MRGVAVDERLGFLTEAMYLQYIAWSDQVRAELMDAFGMLERTDDALRERDGQTQAGEGVGATE